MPAHPQYAAKYPDTDSRVRRAVDQDRAWFRGSLEELVASDGEGAVLVVDGGGSLRCAHFGDNMARCALENGWAGFVGLGAVHDRDELARLDIVTIADVTIRPGAHVYCDTDGILVEP
ncbi:RraA family protein [Promicromonospora soli]